MKKITDFIVDKRNIVLFIFIIVSIFCLYLSSQVNINRDISRYLPSDSETRIGMDIMDEEFKNEKTSSLNVMFKNLKDQEKDEIYKDISSIEGVSKVEHQKNEQYEKDGYTLYVISIDEDAESKEASTLYDLINEKYKDYEIYTSGDIAEENKEVLPIWIVFLAIFCALIILMIMCDSYIEPILFLIAIGMAVILNKGTNIIFSSISSITNAIAAILQLALSMDYSIMLINRYRQEKESEKDNVKAMKKALYYSFTSISSSSITTIVGLLALVFMSFTIGRDLGLVLAKGVLFSLLTIFTCLPALILMFNNLIIKTEKKSPVFHLDKFGNLIHKVKYFGIIIFIIIFLVSYFLKGNLGYLYTDVETDDVSKVFDTNNQMVIVYKNKYEKEITKYCHELEKNAKIDEVLCYGNTINEPLKYENLNNKLNDLDIDTEIDEELLKIIYYKYYSNDKNIKITFNDFIEFIKSDVYSNDDMNKEISDEMKMNIDKLYNFTNEDLMNKKRNVNEIANVFSIDEEKINDLLIYYNSLSNNTIMTMPEFVSFMNNYVIKSKYSSNINATSMNNLNSISKFMNKNNLVKRMNAKEIAKMFNLDEKTINDLYLYYAIVNSSDYKMSINDFANFVSDSVLNDDKYSSLFDENAKREINLLKRFSDKKIINNKISSLEMSKSLGISNDLTQNIYLLIYGSRDNGTKLTIRDFLNSISVIKNNTHYLDDYDLTNFQNLSQNSDLMNNDYQFSATELSELLKVDKNQMFMLYALIDIDNNTWVVSPYEFISFILNNLDNKKINDNLSEESLNNLNTLYYIMTSSINNNLYTYVELSNKFNLPSENIKNIYGLYIFNREIKMTPIEFVNFILNHKNDKVLSNSIKTDTLNKLTLLQKVATGVLNNKRYSSSNLSNVLGMNKDDINLLYSLYAINYKNEKISISYKDFVSFLTKNVISNKKYLNSFNGDEITKIKTIDSIMNNSLKRVKYDKNSLYNNIIKLSDDIDRDLIDLLYLYYGSKEDYDNSWNLTIEKFVNYLNDDILQDNRFDKFIDSKIREDIITSKEDVRDAKDMLIGKNYSRVVLNTKYDLESKDTFGFIEKVKKDISKRKGIYFIGNSPMAHEMSLTFQDELNLITVLTVIFIFIVVALTFKSILLPIILVLLIQTAVFMTMGILSFEGGTVYFISILIVQSILMGATIDYAILYTSYYLESRKTMRRRESIINAYNRSIHTILTSASILTLVTLVVGHFGSAVASKICMTVSQGTICSTILILLIMPTLLASFDKIILRNKK